LLYFVQFQTIPGNAQCPTGTVLSSVNLLINGDFENGNIGFDTDYLLKCNKIQPDCYCITDDAKKAQPHYFEGKGEGNFMVVDGAKDKMSLVWGQKVRLNKNSTYCFVMSVATLNNSRGSAARFKLQLEKFDEDRFFKAPENTNEWKKIYTLWNSKENTAADIKLYSRKLSAQGNDFAIDNIKLCECVEMIDESQTIVEQRTRASGNRETIVKTKKTSDTFVVADKLGYNEFPEYEVKKEPKKDTRETVELLEIKKIKALKTEVVEVDKPEIILTDLVEETSFEKIEKGKVITLNKIYFDRGRSELKSESKDELELLYKILTENPNMRIEIRGHTANGIHPDFLQKLSENRAKAVANYLSSRNINPKRLITVGFGQTRPVISNLTEEGRAKNRRVEVYILEK